MKSVQQAAYLLLVLVLGAIVAKEGSFIFVPLVWGIFFAFALYPISSAFEIKNKTNEPLTGRKWQFQLFPFSFAELVKQHGLIEEKRMLIIPALNRNKLIAYQLQ